MERELAQVRLGLFSLQCDTRHKLLQTCWPRRAGLKGCSASLSTQLLAPQFGRKLAVVSSVCCCQAAPQGSVVTVKQSANMNFVGLRCPWPFRGSWMRSMLPFVWDCAPLGGAVLLQQHVRKWKWGGELWGASASASIAASRAGLSVVENPP